MRIDESTNAASLRPVYTTDVTRPPLDERTRSSVMADTGSSMSDSSSHSGSASPPTVDRPQPTVEVDAATTAATLAAEPRFSALIALMERLTGREITLVPPAMIVLGQRTQAHPHHQDERSSPSPATHITSVRPIAEGRAFRIDAAEESDGSGRARETAHFDVGLDVIQQHAAGAESGRGALRVHVSADAAASQPNEILRIDSGGANAVRVTAAGSHLNQYA